MARASAAFILAGLGFGLATGALAQGATPVGRDVQNLKEVEKRIDHRDDRTGSAPGSLDGAPANRSDIPGIGGPPGTVGDSVNSYAPLPPGAPGNETR